MFCKLYYSSHGMSHQSNYMKAIHFTLHPSLFLIANEALSISYHTIPVGTERLGTEYGMWRDVFCAALVLIKIPHMAQ